MEHKLDTIKTILSKCRRKTERLCSKVSVMYRSSPRAKWNGPLHIENISGGGMRFKSTRRLKTGSTVTLKIDIPSAEKALIFNAKVIWCKSHPRAKSPRTPRYIAGVEFLKMNDKDRKVFVSYICEEILFNYLTTDGEVKPTWT